MSGSATNSSTELAKQIRDDQSLRQVHQMALDLLKGGLNAGTHYPQVWIRDLNTFIIVALEANPHDALRDSLLTFFKFQGPEGDIPDGYLPINPNQKGKPNRTAPLAPGLQAIKNTVEVDQETSLVQAVYKYVTVTGDRTILDEQVDGRSVRDRLAFAMQYLLDRALRQAARTHMERHAGRLGRQSTRVAHRRVARRAHPPLSLDLRQRHADSGDQRLPGTARARTRRKRRNGRKPATS